MYVQRVNGIITGAFALLQPGIAEEAIADDSPDLMTFLNSFMPSSGQTKSSVISAYQIAVKSGNQSAINDAMAKLVPYI